MKITTDFAIRGCLCDGAAPQGNLIDIATALECVAKIAAAVEETERVTLKDAFGRILAQDLRARAMTPPFDNAAMDGYALNAAAMTGEGPWRLTVDGRIPAGQKEFATLEAGSAARIFTGAPIPAGADAVVMQEVVGLEAGHIVLNDRPRPCDNIRLAGDDMAEDEVIALAGRCLGSREIAVCAAGGHDRVTVRRKIRVAVLTTGDEVQPAGQKLDNGHIWDVNTPMLNAALSTAAVELVDVRTGTDDRDTLCETLREMAASADLVVTSGAISVGEEDHVKPALNDLGARVYFSGVALKPGKPVSFGRLGHALWLGLPGNPLSAFVTWHLFGRAILDELSGRVRSGSARRYVVAGNELRHKPGRCELRPGRLAGYDGSGREIAICEAATNSARVARLPDADGLLFIPSRIGRISEGDLVEFWPLAEV